MGTSRVEVTIDGAYGVFADLENLSSQRSMRIREWCCDRRFVGYFTGNKIIDKLKQTATRTQA